MKFLYPLFFIFLISCNNLKHEYVCGDRPCLDKKEFEKFFSESLSIEIVSTNKDRKENVDLVKLNTSISNLKEKDKKLSRKEIKLKKKKEKIKQKEAKKKLLNDRKINEKKEKIRSNNEKKMTSRSVLKQSAKDSRPKKEIVKKKIITKPTQTENIKSVCDQIEDCDIDKIAEILIEKGKKKPFPNIASN